MTWTCPLDGIENSADERFCIGGCGYVRIARRVVLRDEVTGKELRMHVSTAIGRSLLGSISGPDVQFASDPQFEVIKDTEQGLWVLRHHPTAINPTFFNGTKVEDEPVNIGEQARVTIGSSKLPLLIHTEDG